MKKSYSIQAKTIEEFSKVEEAVESLSIATKSQIEMAYESFSIIRIKLKKEFNNKIDLLLPSDLLDISISETEIVAFNSKFSFTMEKEPNQLIKITFSKP